MRTLTFRNLAALLTLGSLLCQGVLAQRPPRSQSLAADRTKSGAAVLGAFVPVASATRGAVVRIEVDGKEAAFGAVVDSKGFILTKASEISSGALVCILADGRSVPGKLVASDDETDLGLVRITADRLKVIEWARRPVLPGQWAVTPGLGSVPEAVGIVSASQRKILPKPAYMGVQLDFNASAALIREILPGMGADKAGLKPGDVVLTVNNAIVTSKEDLLKMLLGFREGETIKVRVRRDKQDLNADIQMMPWKVENNRRFDRQDRMNRLGSQLSRRAEGFQMAIQHDTVLQPWQCGGPLVNLEGKALGLNIARAGRIASYALPAELVQEKLEELKRQAEMPVKQPPAEETGLHPASG